MGFIIVGTEALFVLTMLMFFVDDLGSDAFARAVSCVLSFLLFIASLGIYIAENKKDSHEESISQIVYDNGATIDSIVVFKSK